MSAVPDFRPMHCAQQLMNCCSFGNNANHWSMLLDILALLPEEVSFSDTEQLYNSFCAVCNVLSR